MAILALVLLPSWALAAKRGYQPLQASIIIDAESGQVLHAANADGQSYPASLTKMMTLYMLFDQLKAGKMRLDERLPVSAHAAAQAPSKLGLRPGQSIAVEDAIKALVTKSANDVAVTIAEAIGGSEWQFAKMMTERAHRLGMKNTVFRNASGLPHSKQVTTARDMATLGRALLHDHPRYYAYFKTRSFEWGGRTITTHNRLMLRYDGADGIKTGFINASGFNLVASAKRGKRRLIGVVLGGRTAARRDKDMERLLDAAFAGTVEPAPRIEMVEATPASPEDAAEGVSGTGDADARDWAVQVGAFTLRVSAETAAEKALSGLPLDGGRSHVSETKAGKRRIYRARVVGITEDQARSACKTLRSNKSCMVIEPGV